ncbi:putative dipeptidyl-aminopeptidase B [Clarias magur]|uniref:Putative dipeptidyl-aminopeptidase B n=1 Tax=Clarias magur TaxID=1594786 RepID=A0A8J4U6M9_CLAMG|nr:putative dipeptidyl-aminopeptidase B [Clarias magur]
MGTEEQNIHISERERVSFLAHQTNKVAEIARIAGIFVGSRVGKSRTQGTRRLCLTPLARREG